MTKKSAELSAGLVAIKGTAVPPPDMHTRAPSVRPDVSAAAAEAVAPRPAREPYATELPDSGFLPAGVQELRSEPRHQAERVAAAQL